MKTYKEIKISTFPFDIDLVSGMLWQLDLDGITEFDNHLVVFVNEMKNIDSEDIKGILQNLVKEKFIESFTLEEETLEDKNWNEEFEKNVNVIEVTDKIVIKPSFKYFNAKPNQTIITIDPKMSFGTGEHATTKLVIKLIEKYVTGGEKVLDVGSGTGVLGIVSVMLGADNALCIDNDEWCILNGNENIIANNLEDKVQVRQSELKEIEEKDFDFVVANINKHILIDIVKELRVKIKQTGILILSGLLITDEFDIVNIYHDNKFNLIEKTIMDEWLSLVFKSSIEQHKSGTFDLQD